MKYIRLILTLLLLSAFCAQAQTIKDVGAGVIELLMSSPKVTKNMSVGDVAAFKVVRDLLVQSSYRQHELGVASAGKTEINLRDDSGNQAQLVRDESGNVFLVQNGKIYSINQQVVNQANTLPFYGATGTQNSMLPPIQIDQQSFSGSFEYMNVFGIGKGTWNNPNDIFNRMGVLKDDLYIQFYKTNQNSLALKIKLTTPITDILSLKEAAISNEDIAILYDGENGGVQGRVGENFHMFRPKFGPRIYSYKLFTIYYPPKINALFSYNWHQDLNGDSSMSFDEFRGVKRNFSGNEPILLAASIQGHEANLLELVVYDEYTGSIISSVYESDCPENPSIHGWEIDNLIPGTYLYVVNLKDSFGRVLSTAQERFQLLPSKTETLEQEPYKNQNQIITESVSQNIVTEGSYKNVNDVLFNLITGKIITQEEYIVINSAISGDQQAKEKASAILFDLVSKAKIDNSTFKAISEAINK